VRGEISVAVVERDNVMREAVRSFRDLEVWKIAIEMTDMIYDTTTSFPKEEMYGLISQIRRSAVSVPSNIAEGSARNNTKEYIQFLFIARGSLAELETQLEIARRRKFISDEKYNTIITIIHRIGQMSARLIQALQK
jgi:four helix bundle protein